MTAIAPQRSGALVVRGRPLLAAFSSAPAASRWAAAHKGARPLSLGPQTPWCPCQAGLSKEKAWRGLAEGGGEVGHL